MSSSDQVFSLSIHADYRCRHSGSCCSADWDVPVELPVYRLLSDAMTAGRLHVATSSAVTPPFIIEPGLPDNAAAMLERTETGHCVFFERHSHLCVVHRDLGETSLPATCRHFPRVSLRDVRGTFVSLSHFCPTAASMLFRRDVALAIERTPKAFPAEDYEGLTVAEGDLPPLLHPGMLMDLEGYSAWESHMVARCADPQASPESVLATLARDVGILRGWRPGPISLADAVRSLPRAIVEARAPADLDGSLLRHRDAMAAVPEDLQPPADEHGLDEAYCRWVHPAWPDAQTPVKQFIAAKAFASWTAYQGRGVATIVRGLEAAVALVRVEAARQCRNENRPLDAALLLEAFRSADFILNHLAVGEELAHAWGRVEGEF